MSDPACQLEAIDDQKGWERCDGAGDTRKRADGNQVGELKRKRWEAKQARRIQQQEQGIKREDWIERHAHFCTHLSTNDVQRMRGRIESNDEHIKPSPAEKALDEFLRPYLDLKDNTTSMNTTDVTRERLFIAEGTETVRILIQQSLGPKTTYSQPVLVKSILLKPATLFDAPVKLLTDIEKACVQNHRKRTRSEKNQTNDSTQWGTSQGGSPPFHVMVGPEEALSAVAGFRISRGALGCGVVPKRDEAWLNEFIAHKLLHVHGSDRGKNSGLRLLALDRVSDTANMGSMIRCSAAFGMDAVVLSHDCCDAWYRRSVRVSMGHIFHVPIVRVENLAATLRRWKECCYDVKSYAAVVDQDADLLLEEIKPGDVSHTWCCVMGNEANGISPSVAAACSTTIRINMVSGVDSLSVPIATGILLHGLKARESCTVHKCEE